MEKLEGLTTRIYNHALQLWGEEKKISNDGLRSLKWYGPETYYTNHVLNFMIFMTYSQPLHS